MIGVFFPLCLCCGHTAFILIEEITFKLFDEMIERWLYSRRPEVNLISAIAEWLFLYFIATTAPYAVISCRGHSLSGSAFLLSLATLKKTY